MKKELKYFLIGEIVGMVLAATLCIVVMNTKEYRLDTNRDGKVNVLDTIEIVNYTLGR